jgi:hypothetical protein
MARRAWRITCTDPSCQENARPVDQVDLLENYRDGRGWFRCSCGRHGYIEKSYRLQEGGEWHPFLMGAIRLGEADDPYQPYAFLVAKSPNEIPDKLLFRYYKDLRSDNGRLKPGGGPGGSPVVDIYRVRDLIGQLTKLGL